MRALDSRGDVVRGFVGLGDEEDRLAVVAVPRRPLLLGDVAAAEAAAGDVAASLVLQRLERDAAAGDVVAVHDDEAGGGLERVGGVERHRAHGAEDDLRDVVPFHLAGARDRLQLLLVEHAEHRFELGGDAGGAHAQHVPPPADQRGGVHPEDVRADARRHERLRLVGADQEFTRLGVHLRLERQAGGLAGGRLIRPRTGQRLDGLDRRVLARRQADDVVARADTPGLDGADEDAPVVERLRELVDVLERHAERPVEVVVEPLEVLDLLQHGRPVVPGSPCGARRRCCRRRAR